MSGDFLTIEQGTDGVGTIAADLRKLAVEVPIGVLLDVASDDEGGRRAGIETVRGILMGLASGKGE